jgi:hypothetical protein
MKQRVGYLSAALCLWGCSQPARPPLVVEGAIRVEGAKTGYWQICRLDANSQVHCTVWNDAGKVLKDETYLPLDEGPPPTGSDLRIRGGDVCRGGPYQVCLTNGRIMLPASQFDQLKTWLEK